MRKISTILIFVFVSSIACNGQKEAGRASDLVIDRIKYFIPPPFPNDAASKHETYDHRKLQSLPVPPTKTDTLVCDLWTIMSVKLRLKITTPKSISVTEVRRAIKAYEAGTWREVPGYRPWTHWHFIDRLTRDERDALAKEALSYMLEHGINNGER